MFLLAKSMVFRVQP